MAQVILSRVGAALGGRTLAQIGAQIGAGLDRAAVASLRAPEVRGPRLKEIQVMSAAEGAPMAAVFGRARTPGQVIWAARFREKRVERQAGGGKGGPTVVEHRYSLSFAVAVCEGPIEGVGRVWADGKVMDLSGVAMRVYRGDEAQTPDPLIEAIEGEACGYRGCAYVVFEDLPLEPYGNRVPQLSFEVFRRPPGDGALEARLKSVCLIPGAGEFAYATSTILKRDGLTRFSAENVNNGEGRPDLLVSLDQLQALVPGLEAVTLVVAWFGTSPDAGVCEFRPGVEQAAKATSPYDWRSGGVGRGGARLVSRIDGAPAYGGTPADASVVEAIVELKARGLQVTLAPFILMDCDGYPWRGRISGEATDIPSLFGAVEPGQIVIDGGRIEHHGALDHGLRRMVLHMARLAEMAGGVDGFLVGSELRDVTTIRDAGGGYPAVEALRALAADCRTILGEATAIGYAADWSEYFGHHADDGSGDVAFHLDPLWADPAIDFVGIDYYSPLADQRAPGEAVIEVASGEGFDWWYASEADRLAGVRTPITDGAYGEPWVFRPKDLVSWWSRPHHDRPGGVRSETPTAWVPASKPIRLIEFGCPAVDRGANAPNLFIDPKSDESAPPPFSDGTRDDAGQRRALEAVLEHFANPDGNPVSAEYGGPMIETMSAWCWDARPFPDFPARSDVWGDAGNWALGHWLNGRLGLADIGDLARALGARAGVEIDPGDARGICTGYLVDQPMAVREALAPLAEVFGFDTIERDGVVTLVARNGPDAGALTGDDLALADDGAPQGARVLEPSPDELRLRFIDGAADYQTGGVCVRRDPADGGGTVHADLPLVLSGGEADAAGLRALARADGLRDQRTVHLSPLAALRLEAGDRVALEAEAGLWRVERIELDETPCATLTRVETDVGGVGPDIDWRPGPPARPAGPPVFVVMDLPSLPGAEDDARPVVAAAGEPWSGVDVHAGPDIEGLTARARLDQPAGIGELLETLPPGPLHRLDRAASLLVRIEGVTPASQPLSAVLAGANALAVQGEGGWEVLQFLEAEPVEADVWRLSGLLRGQGGTEGVMGAPAGAAVVVLGEGLGRAEVARGELGLPLLWRAVPAGAAPGGDLASDIGATWRGAAWRPWSPCHFRRTADGDGDRLSWIRRARVGGDGWETEPPLSEEGERYRLEILDGEAIVRAVETTGPAFVWTADMQAEDFPGGAPEVLQARVAQISAVTGPGAWMRRGLWRRTAEGSI